jgi:ABC-type transport system involved in cytochrome c biogenesis permease component
MTFLPIVERELRIMARQKGPYRMRLVTAALGLGLWIFLSIVGGLATVPQRASVIFLAVSILSLGFAMLAGTFLTADCLSEERREGTLGLLFLTDLKGYDVVLGKLVSTSVLAVFSLLAVLPILALPLLMGGMTGGEFWRTTLVLLATIFLSLATGMLVSALSKDSRVAMLGTLLAMVFFAGLLPVLWWLQALVHRMTELDFLLWACPAYTFRRALDAYYSARSGPGEFWISIVTLFALGLVSLATASLLLPRVWQEAPSASAGRKREPGRSRLRFGSPEQQMVQRVWLSVRPYYWLATRDRLTKLWVAGCLGVLLPVWLVIYCGIWTSSRGKADNFFAVAILMSYGLHLIYKCLVAAEASRRLSDDRHSGALELLLATPLTPREIIRAQQDAVWDVFQWSRRLLVGVNLLLLWVLVGLNPLRMPSEPRGIFTVIFLGGIGMLYLDSFALIRAGMWTALTTKRHTHAVLSTIRRVMLPPWLAILLMFFLGTLRMGFSGGTFVTLMALWFAAGIAVDIIVGVNAQYRLTIHFRAAAAGVHKRVTYTVDGLPFSARELAKA